MISEIFFLPIMFLGTFFKELYDSIKLSSKSRIMINIVFSICISVIYGFLLGLYIVVFTLTFFKNTIISIWIPIIIFIVLLEVIQLAIIYSLHEDNVLLPKVYLNIIFLGFHIHNKKYLKKFFIKQILLITVLFILFTSFVFSIYFTIQTAIPIMIVTLSLSILFTQMIFNRVRYDELKKSINQMILNLFVFIIFFSLGVIRLIFYKNLKNESNIIDIGILIGSVFYAYVTIPNLIGQVYHKFLDEFHETILCIWDELEKRYGFKKFKSKFENEIDEIKRGINELKLLWKKGEKVKVIKRFIIAIIFLLLYSLIVIFFRNYNESISYFLNKGVEIIKNYWILLFNGNKAYASASVLLIIFLSLLIYSLCKIIISIKRKDTFQKMRVYVERFFISCFFIFGTISIFPIFDAEKCFFISFGIMVFVVIENFISNKIYNNIK